MSGRQPRKPILLFALRALAWLVPCFAGWYWLASTFALPSAWFAHALVDAWQGGILTGIEHDGRVLQFVTSLVVQQASGERGVLVVEVNPQLATCGTALLAALVLAGHGGWRKLVLGLAVLIPFQGWSMAFEFLAQVLRTTPDIAAQAGLVGWRAEATALAYQLGTLVFPTFVPVALWIALQRRYVGELVGVSSFARP